MSVSLPSEIARQVRGLARRRRLSANQAIIELVEEGIEARRQKHARLLELTERLRASSDANEVARLGDQLGQMILG